MCLSVSALPLCSVLTLPSFYSFLRSIFRPLFFPPRPFPSLRTQRWVRCPTNSQLLVKINNTPSHPSFPSPPPTRPFLPFSSILNCLPACLPPFLPTFPSPHDPIPVKSIMRIAQVNKGGSIPERSRQYLRDSFPETPHGVEGGKEGGKGKEEEGRAGGRREGRRQIAFCSVFRRFPRSVLVSV